MGVDTKGVVVTTCKDVMFVALSIEQAVKRVLEMVLPATQTPLQRLRALAVDIECSPSTDSLRFRFEINGDQRQLSVFFGCDCDHLDKGAQSVSLLLGAWGDSVLIMECVLRVLSVLGPTYLNEADSSAEGYVLQPGVATFTELALAGQFTLPTRVLEKWVACYEAGQMRADGMAFRDLFGFDAPAAAKVLAADTLAEREALLDELLAA